MPPFSLERFTCTLGQQQSTRGLAETFFLCWKWTDHIVSPVADHTAPPSCSRQSPGRGACCVPAGQMRHRRHRRQAARTGAGGRTSAASPLHLKHRFAALLPLASPSTKLTQPSPPRTAPPCSAAAVVPACRICWQEADGDPGGMLLSPCSCSGSSRFVHYRCLEAWMAAVAERKGVPAARCCDVCRARYRG